jgi:hypothetical protein
MPAHIAKVEESDTSTTITEKLARKNSINYLEPIKELVRKRKDILVIL